MSISDKMDYIQNVFLNVQNYMQKDHEFEELMAFLNSEPPEFRSVAYESASFEIGLQELSSGKGLDNWTKLYQRSPNAHAFHMDIGLGWAFAKTEISPTQYRGYLYPVTNWMVFDGIGYYHGLFRGRRTVKQQSIPDGINQEELQGFDQGLGRRLWYIARGEVKALIQLIQPFHLSRHADLWRGVGIACGYVGGCDKSNLEQLLNLSSEFDNHFCTGVTLATISRTASNSVTRDIKLACEIICGKSLEDVLGTKTGVRDQFD